MLALALSCTLISDGEVAAKLGTDGASGDTGTEGDADVDADADGDTDTDTDTGTGDTAPPVDEDGDGYDATVDCNDQDAAVNPGATESCNLVDDDCDGTVDEDDAVDAPTWYADADGDGHGDASATMTACQEPDGYVEVGDDCDDSDASLGAARPWYYDGDRDGFGDAGRALTACSQPAGYLDDSSDCDDASDAVNPDADEVWASGADEDCDGTVDEDDAIEGSWAGSVDLTFTEEGYCYGTFTCSGSASATATVDGAGGVDMAGSYSCTPVASGAYGGWCASYTWTATGTFALSYVSGTSFEGDTEAGDCAPYGFATTTGVLSTSGSLGSSGLDFTFSGRACPAGDSSALSGALSLAR